MGKWKKYPGCFVAFPEREDLLEYELLQIEKEMR